MAGIGFQLSSFHVGKAVSAVPGTRQAWALGGTYHDPSTGVTFLLHISGLTWSRAATFGPLVHLAGVSAASGSAAWVWGSVYPNPHGLPHTYTPFLALVSAGTVRQMRVPSRWRYVWPLAVASHGTSNTWVSGWTRDSRLRSHGPVLARWDGTRWHRVAEPTASLVPDVLSTSGPADTWAAGQWVWHWDGAAWSRSYAPPAGQYRGGAYPGELSVASSAGRAWLTYNMDTLRAHDNPGPSTSYSAYYDGNGWGLVPVPRAFAHLAEVTMAGQDAWAMTSPAWGQPRILRSDDGGGWCPQPPLPGPRQHPGCNSAIASVSAASPTYVVATGGSWEPGCFFAYIYDGRAWRPVDSHPVS